MICSKKTNPPFHIPEDACLPSGNKKANSPHPNPPPKFLGLQVGICQEQPEALGGDMGFAWLGSPVNLRL